MQRIVTAAATKYSGKSRCEGGNAPKSDRLLASGSPAREGTAMVTMPRSLEQNYDLAKAYLCRDPGERAIFTHLEARGRWYHLEPSHRGNDRFDPNSDTITWDPYSALRTTRGGRQSPALGLGHEAAHAVESPLREGRLESRSDRRYDTAEERRVITGSERRAAHTLGESTRSDHRGTEYRVATPVSR